MYLKKLAVTVALIIVPFAGYAQSSIKISLQINNGAPNPGWVVQTPADITTLLKYTQSLPVVAATELSQFGNFIITNLNAVAGFPSSITVGSAVIKVRQNDGTVLYYRDAKGMMTFLVGTAIAKGLNIPDIVRFDLDEDGDIDQDDINVILLDKGKTVEQSICGLRCDMDGDGVITVSDARKMALLCTRPRCATK